MFGQAGPMSAAPPSNPIATLSEDHGRLALLSARPGAMVGGFEWVGISTKGRRDVAYGSGAFVPRPGQSAIDGLRACADLVVGQLPRGLSGVPAVLGMDGRPGDEVAGWVERFERTCGRCTIPVVSHGGDPGILRHLDRLYGPDRVDAVLGRMPVLYAPLRLRAVSNPFPYGLVESCDAIMGDETPSLERLAWHVAECLDSEAANALYDGTRMTPEHAAKPGPWLLALARFLKRMEGRAADPVLAARAMLSCGDAPIDWMPRDAEGVASMAFVLGAALALTDACEGALDVRTLVGPVRGDWRRADLALSRIVPRDAQATLRWARQVEDMVEAYAAEVLRPALGYARVATDMETHSREDARRALRHAWTTLFSGKGLQAVAEANADWHRRGPDMSAAISTLSTMHGSRFPRPFPDFLASNGLRIVPILSGIELVAEGSALNHCVGSQGNGCRRGSYAIASVRAADGVRLSTVKLDRSGKLLEHRARSNADPDEADAIAVGELMRRNAGLPLAPARADKAPSWIGRVRERVIAAGTPAWTARHPYDPSDPVRILRAASYWDRYVPRSARGSIRAILSGCAPILAEALPEGIPGKLPMPVSRMLSRAAGETCKAHYRTGIFVVLAGAVLIVGWQAVKVAVLVNEANSQLHAPAQPTDIEAALLAPGGAGAR
jgi:hypothetical protein